ATRDGSASNGPQLDYFAQSGTLEFRGDAWVPAPGGSGQLVFQPGETNKTIAIRINDDAVGERNETFTVALQNPRAASANALAGSVVLGTAPQATVTILDNETPGHADYEFNPGLGTDGLVHSAAIQADGKVLVAGEFTSVDGVVMAGIGRLHTDGYLDSSFDPGAGANGPVYSVAALADGKVVIGGDFTRVNTTPINRLAMLNADGSVANGFRTGAGVNGPVWAVAGTGDGRIFVGGEFTTIAGLPRRNLARLWSDGSLDTGFNPASGPDGGVYSLAAQADGTVLIGGAFTGVNGASRSYIARLNTDGSVDSAFNATPPPNGAVRDIAIQSDGSIVIGGEFTYIGSLPAGRVARLHSDGTPDPTFVTGTGADGVVFAVAAHADGRIGVGGEFTSFNGRTLNRLARLNSDGSVDTGFNIGAGANDTLMTLKIQPDSALVIGGRFTTVDGLPRNHIARVHGDEKFSLGILQFSAATYRVAENAGSVTL